MSEVIHAKLDNGKIVPMPCPYGNHTTLLRMVNGRLVYVSENYHDNTALLLTKIMYCRTLSEAVNIIKANGITTAEGITKLLLEAGKNKRMIAK